MVARRVWVTGVTAVTVSLALVLVVTSRSTLTTATIFLVVCTSRLAIKGMDSKHIVILRAGWCPAVDAICEVTRRRHGVSPCRSTY